MSKNLKTQLSPLQYSVTQEDATEPPFENQYWNNKESGIYVDIVSGEPLFSSIDKYQSNSGWPSFSAPLIGENIIEKKDSRLFQKRIEVRSRQADSHLGHVFPDGPAPTFQRYCINSAALRFIAAKDLEKQGYGKFLTLFEKKESKDNPEANNTNEHTLLQTAVFAGGCFWCMEPPFEKLTGVKSVTSGYSGGNVKNPTYEQVSRGDTGHTEAVEVTFNPKVITYEELLDVFWRNIDPTVKNRQFCDHGSQYRAAIFYSNDKQKAIALESKERIANNKNIPQVVTEITPLEIFYPAETYHQDYHSKNPIRYRFYRQSCGRDRRLKELWGKDK